MGSSGRTGGLQPREGYCWLFVYGLLKPGLQPPHTLQLALPDAVPGELYDLGPYPALKPAPAGSNATARGFTLLLNSAELERLDEFEGVAEGLYRRRRVVTSLGLEAWVYEYARPLPADARGPLISWPPEEGTWLLC